MCVLFVRALGRRTCIHSLVGRAVRPILPHPLESCLIMCVRSELDDLVSGWDRLFDFLPKTNTYIMLRKVPVEELLR